MPDTETKPWWRSKTILGAIAVLVAFIVRQVTPDAALDEDAVLNVLTLIGEALGALLVIFGRVTATQRLRK